MGEQTYRLDRSHGIGYAVRGFSRNCLIRLIDYPELPLRMSTRQTVKAGRSALLVQADLPVGNRMLPVAYKRIRRIGWLKKLMGLVRRNRTLRSWRLGLEFLNRGIATARPLAVIVPRPGTTARDSFLVTEWIDGGLNLTDFCRRIEELPPSQQARLLQAAAFRLGNLLGQMHAAGITHRDLKPGNLMLVPRGGDVTAYVIDLDGANIRRRIPYQLRLRNLSRLALGLEPFRAVGSTVRLRFLVAYLTAVGERSREWKSLWRDLDKLTTLRRHQKQRTAARRNRRATLPFSLP